MLEEYYRTLQKMMFTCGKMDGSKVAVLRWADAQNLANNMRRRKKHVWGKDFAASL